jgi:hypothetical protein
MSLEKAEALSINLYNRKIMIDIKLPNVGNKTGK